MKLQRVLLRRPIRLPGMSEPDSEITDKECPDLRYDEKQEMVYFTPDLMRPREAVEEMERDNEMLVCPECGEEKANPSAMGSHRSAKHGVRGVGKGAA